MIDITRSMGVLNPHKIKEQIHVIGVGATGSTIVDGLIRQGFNGSQITVYDFDHVEEHNIANQMFTYKDVGKQKVVALRDMIKDNYKETINIIDGKFDTKTNVSGIVFLLVDSFAARKEIFKSIKNKPSVKCVIETRLDARAGTVMIFSPCSLKHQKYFEATLYDDNDEDTSEVSVCGTRQVVSQTVSIISGMAVWEMIKWANDPTYMGKYCYVSCQPWHFETEEF